jgi:hypothetical protein
MTYFRDVRNYYDAIAHGEEPGKTAVMCGGQEVTRDFPIPTRLSATTDIKISGIASATGVASSALRGWLE